MASRARENGHALKKGAGLSSRVSLFSAFTSSSSGSSGSTATVTPESMSRAQSRRKSTTSKPRTSKHMPPPKRKREIEPPRPAESSSIDVFQFLDPTRSRNSSRLSIAENGPSKSMPIGQARVVGSTSPESSARSLHSDSGISIRDSSPESLSRRESELEMVEEGKPLTYNRKAPSHYRPNKPSEGDGRLILESSSDGEDPESYYLGPVNQRVGQKSMSVLKPKHPTVESDFSGYDLLAQQLSDGRIQPMYRRFDWLQHRTLLHLQDELAELEEELKRLDYQDAQYRLAARRSQGRTIPASRRLDWQYQGTAELCARRVEISAITQTKLKQYNKMLHAYQDLQCNLPTAHPDMIEEYRSWIMETYAIATDEAKFLEHSEELVMTSCPSRFRVSSHKSTVQSVVMIVAGSIMVPLLAFSVIPTFLPRLFVVALTVLVLASLYQMEGAQEIFRPEEIRSCSLVYLGVMLIAAFAIP